MKYLKNFFYSILFLLSRFKGFILLMKFKNKNIKIRKLKALFNKNLII